MTLKELAAKLAEASGKLKKVLDQAGPDMDTDLIKEVSGTPLEKIEAIRKMKADEDALGKQVDEAQELVRMKVETAEREEKALALGRPGHPVATKKVDEAPEQKFKGMGLGDIFMKGCEGKPIDFKEREVSCEGLSLKTLMETAAGWSPQAIRTGEVVPYATRPIAVIDVIPQGSTNQSSVAYMEATTFTNNAAERAEGAIYGEAALAFTARSAENEDIAVWLPITDRQLEDVPMVQGEVNRVLPFMLQQRLDYQIINGDGTSPNLEGVLAKAGIQTYAKAGADTVADAFYKGMTKIRKTAFAEPSAHIMHPDDAEGIRLMKDMNGNYIWGHPSEAGVERLWGKPMVATTAIAANTGLTGDFQLWSTFFEHHGVIMKITDSHDTYFIYGKQAIRAIMRGAMVWKRPAAFCTVTGI